MPTNTTPLVTIAMVTYNSSLYLQEAINSALSSTYKDFELLIADDCSTDNTWNIIQSYKDNRIRAIQHKNNLGEYNNRNFCLKEAEGKYIIYIDGDDKIFPDALETFVQALESNPACGMAISRPEQKYWNKSFNPFEAYQLHYLGQSILNLALVRVCFNREKFAVLGGFSSQYKSGDDYARLLMASKYPTLILKDKLVWWRKSPNSASDKLFNSYNGVYEPFAIKYFFINKASLFSVNEKKLAHRKLRQSFFNTLKSLLRKGKIYWLFKLLITYPKIVKLGQSN